LLELLPPLDPQGGVLAQPKKGVWVVKHNDCQEFSTREGAAWFWAETEIFSPALKAQNRIRVAQEKLTCRWPKALTPEQAVDFFDILKRFLAISETHREKFLSTFTGSGTAPTWSFESWEDHKVTFMYDGSGPDFRGDALSSTTFSSLLIAEALMEMRRLHQKGVEPPISRVSPVVREKERWSRSETLKHKAPASETLEPKEPEVPEVPELTAIRMPGPARPPTKKTPEKEPPPPPDEEGLPDIAGLFGC
jgi:hypothetical protein